MSDQQDPNVEPDNSTVDDWHGQEVEKDTERAEQALAEAGGDEEEAAKKFESGS